MATPVAASCVSDAQRVIQLPVAVRRRADDDGEEGGQEPDQRDTPGRAKAAAMNGPMARNPTSEMLPPETAKMTATADTQTRATSVAMASARSAPQALQPGRTLVFHRFGHVSLRVAGRDLRD